MADKAEKDLDQASDCGWIRALDADGNSIRIEKSVLVELIRANMPVATSEKSGLMTAFDFKRQSEFSIPGIDTQAVHIADIKRPIGFQCASIVVRLDAFRLSVLGIISFNITGHNTDISVQFIGFAMDGYARIHIVENNGLYKLYISGSYPSAYESSASEAMSNSGMVSLFNNQDSVPVSELQSPLTYVIRDYIL